MQPRHPAGPWAGALRPGMPLPKGFGRGARLGRPVGQLARDPRRPSRTRDDAARRSSGRLGRRRAARDVHRSARSAAAAREGRRGSPRSERSATSVTRRSRSPSSTTRRGQCPRQQSSLRTRFRKRPAVLEDFPVNVHIRMATRIACASDRANPPLLARELSKKANPAADESTLLHGTEETSEAAHRRSLRHGRFWLG